MRKAIFLFLLFGLLTHARASTSITSSNISGHWAMSGSPYLVFNDVTIVTGDSLTIDPGVEIIFQGSYQLNVEGNLFATGSTASPIKFHVQDTTGWSNTAATSGGWKGIYFGTYGFSSNNSCSFQYCDVSDMKSGGVVAYYMNMSLKNCNFFHNYNDAIAGNIDTGHVFEISGCNIYNDSGEAIGISSSNGGGAYIHNCSIHDNSGPMSIIHLTGVNLLFANNDINNNTTASNVSLQSAIDIENSTGEIMRNKIHNNASQFDAALICDGGNVDINGNLICNNQHMSGTCGALDGGGGVHLSTNGSSDPSTTFFTVRNNVIANNYSPFVGGGIKVFWANVSITNNQIINNSGFMSGGIHLTCDTFSAIIRNNLFYNNKSTGLTGITANVGVDLAKNITYEHNWSQNPYYTDFFAAAGSYAIAGDTTTNVIGTDPGIINPTTTADVTESALAPYNFSLLPASPCINKGDTTGAFPDSVDCAGNPRIYGPKIDIGAFEYSPTEYAHLGVPGNLATAQNIAVYPNPASNIVFISTPGVPGTIKLSDISGNVVAEKKVANTLTSFDIHLLPKGIYFVAWNDGNDQKAGQKVIVE